jgi:hypothetical protein
MPGRGRGVTPEEPAAGNLHGRVCEGGASRWAMVDLNGHEAGNGGYSQRTPTTHRDSSTRKFIEGAPLDEHTVTERRPGKHSLIYHYRWIEGVPLRDGKDALSVNWLGVSIINAQGKTTYDGAFVTSLPVTADNVVEVAACARSRWKIENESFNVLKNHGYHLEHNFGHGKQHLAQLFVLLNLLAFAFHTVCDSVEKLWQETRVVLGTRKGFFSDLHTITAYLLFPNWHALCSAMVQGNAPPT